MSIQIERLDHLVLTVENIERTCEFYSSVLGMDVVTWGENRRSLHFGAQKINLHQRGREFEPRAHLATPGSSDLCFITATPMEEVVASLRDRNVDIIEGPVERTGAVGPIESVYFRDPDRNLLEVSNTLS